MCAPAIPLALQIASAAASVAASVSAANTQRKSNNQQRENTIKAYNTNFNQLNLQQQQEAENATQKIQQNNIRAAEAQATAQTTMGQRGVTGLSVQSLLDNLSSKQSNYNLSVLENNERTQQAINGQRQNLVNGANSQINALKTPAMPDYLGGGLKIYNAIDKYNTDNANGEV